jgi:hypothetical protein
MVLHVLYWEVSEVKRHGAQTKMFEHCETQVEYTAVRTSGNKIGNFRL